MLRSLSCLALIVLVASVCATPASAQCAGFSQVFGHQIGGTLVRCADNGQVSGFVFAIGATATINSSTVLAPPQTADFICEADGEPSQGFGTCVGGAGVRGDGIITIDGNWSNNGPLPTGPSGCPDSAQANGVGRNVMIIRDLAGGGAILSVGFDQTFSGFVAEFADRLETGTGNEIFTSCVSADGLSASSKTLMFDGVTKGGDTTNTTAAVQAHAMTPKIFSDCDPDSYGAGGDCITATGAPEPPHTFAPGPFYSKTGPCGTLLDLNRGTWAPYSVGTSLTFPSQSCLFVGNTLVVDGVESPAIAGALSIPGNLAPAARALDVRAKQAGGDVVVSWRTDSEIGLQGFTVQTKSGRQIGGMVAPKGIGGGGASYSVSLKRGDFKNEKSLYVVSATTDGQLKSDLASF